MEVDNSDILGGPILKNSRGNQSSWFSASTIVLTVLGLLGLYIAGVQVWARVLVWKEKSYKLAMRRRHGIPDNDHRPFNVAYAAVVLARQEQEAAARKAMLQRPPAPPQSEPEPVVRQRQGVHREQSSAALMNVPGRFDFPSDSGYSTGTSRANGYPTKPFSDRLNFEDRYNPAPATHVNESIYSQSSGGRSRRASHKSIVNGDSRKRAYTADEDVDPNDVKKSKHEHGERDVEEVVVPRRGYKRGASQEEEDDDEAYESKRGREKRLRKVSLEKSPQYDSEMEIYAEEDEDNVPEMTALVRGKKRDRAEAGSTFGGDEEDSSHEAEVDDQKSHRHRKRRNRRKSEGVPSRGTKRDRDAEEEASDIDSDEAQVKASRKKRGKKLSPKVEVDDASMDDSPTPSVASGRVKRRIGEEWESNGVKFKIGPNGQRLRQTLVKKERQKFPMPMDSQHPDRQVNLEVCVETWLTEEEYREAKENHRLAWQDASKSPSEPATPATIEIPPPSPRKGGKDLLWQSTATGLPTPQVSPPSTPAKQNGFRQSMIGNGVTPITPFQPGHASSKRIASAPRHSFPSYGSPGLANSINGKPQLTRWEKEEMEANAIMKLRRKKDEETKKLQEEQEKAEKEKKAKEAAASVPKLPAITITKPEETKPAEAKPTPSLFGPPTTCTQPTKPSLFGPTPTATSGDAKAPGTSTAPAAAPSKPAESPFGFGPKPAEKPSPSPLFPSLAGSSAPAVAPASQGGSGLKFSFPTSAPTANAPKPEEKKDTNQGSGLKFSFPTSAPIASAPKLEEKEAAPSTSQNSGSSLFSRMGPQPTSMPGPTPSASTGNSSPFSFAKTTTEAPKPASPFFNSASTIMPAATTSAAEPPKFNFGFNQAPPAAPTSSSSLSGALGNEPKPAAAPSPSFGFPKLDAPTQQATGSATSGSIFGTPAGSGTSTGPFNFGGGPSFGNKTEQKAPEADKAPAAPATPAKSPFNFAPSTSTNGSSATTNSSTTKPTFSFGATAPSGPTAFSNSSSTPSTNNASQPAFGGGFSMPSSNTATSAAAPAKFSFGTPSTTSTATEAPKSFGSTTSATSQDSKPASTFGSTTMNGSATNGEAPKPLFGGFGSNTSAPSPFSSNGAFGGSTGAFGATKAGEAAKTPATFGFGASSTTGAQQPSLSFGTPSTANGSSNTFGFGDATKSTTQPTTTSLFGSSTTNGTASSFSSFGAAAGGSPFSFGKTPSTSGDSK